MRFNAWWVGIALCGLSRVALAQNEPETAPPSDSESLPPPPPAPAGVTESLPPPRPAPAPAPKTVTVGPQQREEAQPSSSNTDDVFGGGYSRDTPSAGARARAARPSAFRANRHWYGWQVLTSDAVSISLFAVGSSAGSQVETLVAPGITGYALGGPVIHLAHSRPGMIAASLGVRIPLPLLGASIGARAGECYTDNRSAFCGGPGLGIGFFLGMALASALDAGLFAWDKPEPKASTGASFGVTPVLSADGKRGELRAFGQF